MRRPLSLSRVSFTRDDPYRCVSSMYFHAMLTDLFDQSGSKTPQDLHNTFTVDVVRLQLQQFTWRLSVQNHGNSIGCPRSAVSADRHLTTKLCQDYIYLS